MQDLGQGNYKIYETGIRPTQIWPRIRETTDTESTRVEVRMRRDCSLVAAVTFICRVTGSRVTSASDYSELPPKSTHLQTQCHFRLDNEKCHCLESLGSLAGPLINSLHGNTYLTTRKQSVVLQYLLRTKRRKAGNKNFC